jgi:hypothetical protein
MATWVSIRKLPLAAEGSSLTFPLEVMGMVEALDKSGWGWRRRLIWRNAVDHHCSGIYTLPEDASPEERILLEDRRRAHSQKSTRVALITLPLIAVGFWPEDLLSDFPLLSALPDSGWAVLLATPIWIVFYWLAHLGVPLVLAQILEWAIFSHTHRHLRRLTETDLKAIKKETKRQMRGK